MVTVRAITYDDFIAVCDLLTELGRPEVSPSTRDAVHTAYVAHVDNPSTFSMVAVQDGKVVGFIALELRNRLNWSSLEAWIPDFIVAEAARGTGAGHALFEKATQIAHEHGCHRMILESGYVRKVAHEFYTQHGMRNAGYYFTLRP
jgi:PhnO protein